MSEFTKSVSHKTVDSRAFRKLTESKNKLGSSLTSRPKVLYSTKLSTVKVIYEGRDVTAKTLTPHSDKTVKERLISDYEISARTLSQMSVSELRTQSTSKFYMQLHNQTVEAESSFQVQSYLTTYLDDFSIEPEGKTSQDSGLTYYSHSEAASIEEKKPLPSHISLVLTETPTFYVLDIPSITAEKDSEEGVAVAEHNQRYEYLTEGKGRNRRVHSVEVQTVPVMIKSRYTTSKRTRHKHNYAFASEWDMYDTYSEKEKYQDERVLDEEDSDNDKSSTDGVHMQPEDGEMEELMKNASFLEAVCIMERLLANNNFSEQQSRFRGFSDPDPFREKIEYNYNVKLLWTFANEKTQGRCVTAICWNAANKDILAVGYGKFYFQDRKTGVVMLWNIKNPVQPERCYDFSCAVTSVAFSKKIPNLLAVGFYDGVVIVLDISDREIHVIGRSCRTYNPSFEPIWHVDWIMGDYYHKNEDQIRTSCQDGRICKFRILKSVKMITEQVMRVTREIGKIKGLQMVPRCFNAGIHVRRYPGALYTIPHPAYPDIYFVGTTDGMIARCSRNYLDHHLGVFKAHDGPIFQMKFSPFCNKLFLTCGVDWNIRIWADGILEPLFELSQSMHSVQGADWSPVLSTLIASIGGPNICLWDIQRKTYLPQSVTASPTKCQNTVVQFTDDGRCLVVGDIEGHVHIFALDDLPFPPFFQADLLKRSLKRVLITNPHLTYELHKLGSLNFDMSTFGKHFR